MYYHSEKRLAYLAHPRTASTATAHVLFQIGFRRRPPQNHHSRLYSKSAQRVIERRLEWTVFTTVRNHWDAVASWMFVKPWSSKPPWSAEDVAEFLSTSRWTREHRLWFHAPDADYILRYETLQEDFDRLIGGAGLTTRPIPLRNPNRLRNGRPYQKVFKPRAIEYVRGYFAEEIQRYGYEF